MTASTNWIHNLKHDLSLKDKLIDLLKIGHKLVLCQLHELERIRPQRHIDRYGIYINSLYDHYILKQLPKTYLLK